MLKHKKEKPNPKRKTLEKMGLRIFHTDGLSNLK